MKKLFAFALLASAAIAASATGVGQAQHQTSTSESQAQASNAGNTQQIIFQGEDTAVRSQADREIAGIGAAAAIEVAKINSDVKIRNTPSMAGPNLTTSNDTCMGSVSGSVAVPGFGIGGGSTVIDENCVMLKNSREMWNMGMKAAALARMCMDAKNKEALEMTGFECPQTTAEKQKAAATNKPATKPAVAGYTGDDEVVIRRLANAK